MHRALLQSVVAVLLSLLVMTSRVGATGPSTEELLRSRQWMNERLNGDPAVAPFSFKIDGEDSRIALKTWEQRRTSQRLDERRTNHTLVYTDTRSHVELRCEITEYHDFPSVEWVLYLRNGGTTDSPIIEDILALDSVWRRGPDCEFLLHHATGSPANGSDYGPLETPLGPGATKRVSAAGGRPTNSDWSYFNLQWGTDGVIVVVGWPGQWTADFVRDSTDTVSLRAGQDETHFSLRPGEEVRSPLIVLQSWSGDWIRAQNIWRRWMMDFGMPKPGGQLPLPQFVASSSRAYEEMIGANEANQIMHIDRYLEEKLKIDYWWMDAGWYVQQQGWPQVGTWEVDAKRFPRGLRPISDHAHANKVKTIVWFEPERVMPGTWLYENHPEWLLSPRPEQEDRLAGLRSWSSSRLGTGEPCVTCNTASEVRTLANTRWNPGQLSLHPGPKGELSVVRFTASETGNYAVDATFSAIDTSTTTSVAIQRNEKRIFTDSINLNGAGDSATFQREIALAAGDDLDFLVEYGNDSYVCDSTGLDIHITSPTGAKFNAAHDFRPDENHSEPWTYGYYPTNAASNAEAFQLYDTSKSVREGGMRLLNLGNRAAREWLTDHIDRLITDQGIDLYRQDFNIDPLPFWRSADTPNRQGITENMYVMGYLAYWDELRRRHPKMLIDACASGGRRNDLESMRRAVPLWRSDYAYEATGQQCMTYGISLWLPFHGTGTVASAAAPYYGGGPTKIEPYAWWSNAAPSLGSGIDIREKNLDYDLLRTLYRQFRDIGPYYYGDFHPLTDWTRRNDSWMAWQFHRPDLGEGVVQVFRRGECPDDSRHFRLHGLDPGTKYELTITETNEHWHSLGKDLMSEGLLAKTSDRPHAIVIIYKRL